MNIVIHGRGFGITPALAAHVRRRLGFVLGRHGVRIQRVSVRLGDVNGPRGGVDKYCRIQVHLLDAPVAAIEELGDDLYPAIDRAADRVGRVVVKRIDRTLAGRRLPRPTEPPARTPAQPWQPEAAR